jgi:transporter family-2 protein
MRELAFALMTLAAGASFVMQQAVNANLRNEIGSAAWAGFVSYFGGTICMLVLAVALRDAAPSLDAVGRSDWISWSGGFFGAIYIAISILLVPRFGAAAFVALLIAGQLLTSLAFDQFGAFNVPIHAASPSRLLGAALLIAGAVLVRR